MARWRPRCAILLICLCLSASSGSLAAPSGPTVSDARLQAIGPETTSIESPPQRSLALSIPAAYGRCTQITYQSWVDASWNVMTMAADGSEKTRITDSDAQDEAPSMSDGCALVVFSSDRDGNDNIYRMNADGSSPQRLTSNSADDVLPALSPDGATVAFQSYRNGSEPEIYVMPTSGGTPTRLTWNGSYDGQPTWSPDGGQIAFISNRSGSKNVWIMSATGTGAWQATALPHAGGPAWSPDGEWIALASDDIGSGFTSLWRVRSDASDAEMLYRPEGANTDAWPSTWSPDSQYILFEQAVWEYDQDWEMTSSRLDLIDVDDPNERTTLAGGGIHMDASWARCDVTPPASWINPLPEHSVSPLTLTWAGADDCATPLQYQLQYRIGDTGSWTDWQVTEDQDWTSDTQGTLSIHAVAVTLYFRIRAKDALDNEESWHATHDASTTIPAQVSGQIVDARSLGVAAATVHSLKPLGFDTEAGADGSYILQTAGEQVISLRASAPGHTSADLQVPLAESAAQADIVLLPLDESLNNGSFENAWAGWDWTRGSEVVEVNYGYGEHIARLGYAPDTSSLSAYPQVTTISQRVTVPATANSPTLSLVYAIANGGERPSGQLSVDIISQGTTNLLSSDSPTPHRTLDDGSTAPEWQLLSADLAQWANKSVKVRITFDHQWGAGHALIDRVSVGPWMTPLVSGISPQRVQPQTTASLSIRGANFGTTGPLTATIDGQIIQVTAISPEEIRARLSPLEPGLYDLWVQNPDGAGCSLPDALLIQSHVVVPLILR